MKKLSNVISERFEKSTKSAKTVKKLENIKSNSNKFLRKFMAENDSLLKSLV